jgi:hypothetical protein
LVSIAHCWSASPSPLPSVSTTPSWSSCACQLGQNLVPTMALIRRLQTRPGEFASGFSFVYARGRALCACRSWRLGWSS